MRNILLLVLDAKKSGGVQTRISNYARKMKEAGALPVILSIGNYPGIEKRSYLGSVLYNFPVRHFWAFPGFLARTLKKHNIDVLHVIEGYNGLLEVYSLLYARLMGLKCGISCYGGEVKYINEMGFLQKGKLKPFEMLKMHAAFLASGRIAVNSQSTLSSFVPSFFRKKCAIVYPGASSELLGLNPAKPAERKHNILAVGRVHHRKGVDDLIRALCLLKKEFPDATLTVCGKGMGNCIAELESLASSLGIGKMVEFTGEASSAELAKRYSECEVFCLPSKTLKGHGIEGFGCVFLEAALFRKPAVGTRHFGIPEAVVEGKTGLLVDENSPEQIAGAIARLFRDKKLAERLGGNGFRRTTSGFMDAHSAGRLVNLYG